MGQSDSFPNLPLYLCIPVDLQQSNQDPNLRIDQLMWHYVDHKPFLSSSVFISFHHFSGSCVRIFRDLTVTPSSNAILKHRSCKAF